MYRLQIRPRISPGIKVTNWFKNKYFSIQQSKIADDFLHKSTTSNVLQIM